MYFFPRLHLPGFCVLFEYHPAQVHTVADDILGRFNIERLGD